VDTESDDQRDGDEAADEASSPAEPTRPLTVADLVGEGTIRPRNDRPAWSGWASLAVLGIAAAVLVAVVLHADIGDIADDGWRNAALWAAGIATGLLGVAVAAISWTLPTGPTSALYPRVLSSVAVLVAFAAVVVVGLADEQGGESPQVAAVVRSSGNAPVAADGTTAPAEAEPPVSFDNAFAPEALTSSAIPIIVRTLVILDLTRGGRELIAGEMGCPTSDLVGTTVGGTAIGGTWAEPLVVLSPPNRANGDPILRCRAVMVRLPVDAGLARPL
jgi:hypothetical protein